MNTCEQTDKLYQGRPTPTHDFLVPPPNCDRPKNHSQPTVLCDSACKLVLADTESVLLYLADLKARLPAEPLSADIPLEST